ncbi:GGDEF domain-containing protein [Candidatus Parcubacteria bacterium]|nr:GGDEF domain-containing protein [Candidatus Parcubacteria bacterium]
MNIAHFAHFIITVILFIFTVFLLFNNRRLKSDNHQLKQKVNEDDLTGLYKRGFLEQRLEEEKNRVIRFPDYEFQILFIDIDDFGTINNTFGHLVGDKVLKKIASILKSEVRPYDIVARFGGDEFVLLLLPGVSGENAAKLAKRLNQKIKEGFTELPMSINVSIGITKYNKDSKENPLEIADQAMYKNKRRHGNGSSDNI